MKIKSGRKFKLKYKLDRFVDAFLYSKTWKKYWRKKFNDLRWYYQTKAFVKLLENLFGYKFKNYNIYTLGQSHLDAAWKWTKISTIRRVILTLQRAIENLNLYPLFLFSQSSPLYYQWIKKLRPNLFEEIKKFVKKGRFELSGGMWVESDTNLPNGESLVRQRLYGQHFYLKNFGKISKVEFLPDSFGFSANLPQILVKSGAEYFYTSKITWNDYSEFPFANFYWKGIDGSSIFTHCFYYHIYVLMNLSKYKELARKLKERKPVFNSNFKINKIKSHLQHEYVKTCSFFYGFSDGGMGPFEEEIGLITNMARLGLLKVTTVKNFFEILKNQCAEHIPVWDDELYLEFHRGCYTSQAKIKELNRYAEIGIRNLEMLSTILSLFSQKLAYSGNKLEKMWKTLLFNQFHDILPGSSIQDVYYEQESELRNLIRKIQGSIDQLLTKIGKILTERNLSVSNNDYLVFNPLSWERDDILEVKNGTKIEQIELRNISPMSFRIISLSNKIENGTTNDKVNLNCEENENEIIVQNSKIKFIIDKNSGKITSLKSNEFKKQFLAPNRGIEFKIYKNRPPTQYAAWNIDPRYTQNPIKIEKVKKIEILEKNFHKISISLKFRIRKSEIIQIITLRENSDCLEFNTKLKIRDKNLLIKIRFPINLNTNETVSEIPYGALKRTIIPRTKFQEAKWEFPAQKWIAMSDKDYGIVLANDHKYGFSANKKGLSMSLLATTHYPIGFYFSYVKTVPKKQRKKYIDLGDHSVNYALRVYKGNWVSNEVWKFGYEFNYPCILKLLQANENTNEKLEVENTQSENKMSYLIDMIKNEKSFIELSNSNIILQVLKTPESLLDNPYYSNNELKIIVRLYETSGQKKSCRIKFAPFLKIRSIFETDLLELKKKDKRKLIENENEILILFTPFEIKTFQVQFFDF